MNKLTIDEAIFSDLYELLKIHKSYCNRKVCMSDQELSRQQAYYNGMFLMYEIIVSNIYHKIPDELNPYNIT